MTELDETFAAFQVRRVHERIEGVARRLRDIADEVERAGKADANHVGSPEHSWRAYNAVHAVTWGVANLNLDGLVLAAAEADRYAERMPHEETRG